MVCWEIVEPHSPNRVMRQFGLVQSIPDHVPLRFDEHRKLHNLTRGGKTNKNWARVHDRYISSWNDRSNYPVVGTLSDRERVEDGYMDWFLSHTVLYVSNPQFDAIDHDGFQNDGSAYQLMVDGMVNVHQLASQGDQSNPQYRQIQNRVAGVLGLAHEQNRLLLPTHLSTEPATRTRHEFAEQRVRRRVGVRRGRGRRENIANEQEIEPVQTPPLEPVQTPPLEPVQTPPFQPIQTPPFQPIQSPHFGPNYGDYHPNFGSASNSFFDFGVDPHAETNFFQTPTSQGAPGSSHQWSSFADFSQGEPAFGQQSRFENVTPINLNLSMSNSSGLYRGETGTYNEDEQQADEQGRRTRFPSRCGTGSHYYDFGRGRDH